MLLEFKVKNFLSFENEQQFIMNAGKGRSFNDRTYRDNYNKILKFGSLFGANGSGKSNFIKSIAFSKNYIVRGNNRATIQKYYKLNPSCKELPSKFEYKFFINKKVYTYGFELVLTQNHIESEWLIYNGTKSDKLIYRYSSADHSFTLGDHFKNNDLKTKLRLFAEAIFSSKNELFIKSISKYNNIFTDYEEAVILQDVYNWFNYNLKVKLPDSAVTDYAYFMQEKNTDDILRFFKDFDLSISNYDFIECPKDRIAGRLPKEVFDDLISRIEKDLLNGDDIESNRVLFGLNDDFFVAKYLDEQVQFETIQFYHENTNVPFHMYEESDGTKKIFKLLEILFQEDDDIVYIVDEIDRCLHPLLTYNFINAFLEKVKTKNCQLIISTQESLLLDFKILRKDEIWFVSKENGHSILSKLDPTKDRADKKLVKAYLEGDKGTPKIINNVYKYS